jgi:transposase
MRKNLHENRKRARARELAALGLSVREIAGALGVTRGSAQHLVKQAPKA